MFRKAIVIGIFIISATGAYSQDSTCQPDCGVAPAFSVETIHRMRGLWGQGPSIVEARWHKTSAYPLVMLSRGKGSSSESGWLLAWKIYDDWESFGRTIASGLPLVQLEIAQDMVIAGTCTGSLNVWDLMQETFLYEVQIADGLVSELLAHPSEEWLLVAIDNERLFRFDLASRSVAAIDLHAGGDPALDALAFSNDGRLLASAGNGVIQIWDTDSWTAAASADIGAASLAAVHFVAGDSQLIVLADAIVSRWSLAGKDLTLLRRLKRHPDRRPCRITVGDISPDETLLMTMDSCVQKRAWDLTTDREIYIPPIYSYDAFQGTVSLFSPDGRYYLSGGDYLAWSFKFVGPEE